MSNLIPVDPSDLRQTRQQLATINQNNRAGSNEKERIAMFFSHGGPRKKFALKPETPHETQQNTGNS